MTTLTPDGMILRTQLTPIFDEYDIDVVLQGHDHTYSRTKLLYGDGQTHGTYEFRLNEDGSDYDWDNAYNTQTDEQIPLYPEDGRRSGQARRIPSRQRVLYHRGCRWQHGHQPAGHPVHDRELPLLAPNSMN